MSVTLGRINGTAQVVKSLLDDAEAQFPGDPTLEAIHGGLSDVWGLVHLFCQQQGWEGPQPLDGEPKPGHP